MDQNPNNQSPISYSSSAQIPNRYRKPTPLQSMLNNTWGIIKFVFAVGIMVVVINAFGFQSYEVFGQSMHPTLNTGDRLLISKVDKTISTIRSDEYIPKRGEIVVFTDPRSSGMQLIKRVVGLPGERVVLEDGEFTIYNSAYPAGFDPDVLFDVDFLYTSGLVDVTIPEGEIFVTGDNRQQGGSLDSRNELGTIPLDKIVGELVLRIYPVSEASLF